MAKEIFISYSSPDKSIAHEIYDAIENSGIKAWIAPDSIPAGMGYAKAIVQGIKECPIMVLIYSNKCNTSEHVANEIEKAVANKKIIIPFCIDDSTMSEELSYYLARKQHIIAYPNYKEHIQDLLVALNSALGRSNLNSIKKQKDEPISALPSNDLVRNTTNPQKEILKKTGKSLWKGFRTLVDVYNSSDKGEGEHPISLIHGKTSESGDIPKSLSFDFEGRKFYMILSEDESYYIGNINAQDDDLNWLDNKWVNTMGSVALCAGAAIASFSTLLAAPLVILGLLSLGKKTSNIDETKSEDATNIIVDKELCNSLSEQTGYLFQLPCENELKGVKDYAIPFCIILRLKENPKLLTLNQNNIPEK